MTPPGHHPPLPDQLPHSRHQSLRGRLLALLLAAVALAAGVQGVLAYRGALAEADGLFDYHMAQMAQALSAGLPLGITPGGPPLPRGATDDFTVQVWRIDGVRIYPADAPLLLPDRAVLGFSNLRTRHADYRVYAVQTPSQVIQVAQNLASRSRLARGLAWRTVAPIALAMPLLMLAVWWVVSSALKPVQRVQRQLAQRQPDDLADVAEQDLPSEVLPLVQELNALLGRVRRAFEAQQAFVADAAHELRSPLTALRLQAQALQRASAAADALAPVAEPADTGPAHNNPPAQPPARAEAAAQRALAGTRLLAGIDRASRLVDQLLALAREQGGRAEALEQPVRLDLLARELLAELAGRATEAGLQLALDPADAVTVPGQPAALAMALRNLVENAIKYTPAGGQVQVSVQRHGAGALLQVDDSGPGISAAQRSQALARFHRLPGSTGAGSGLGLAIVQAVAERHGAGFSLGTAEPLGGLRAVLRFARTLPLPVPVSASRAA